MNTQANLALRGAFFGSLLVCFLCCILTAGNTSVSSPTKARAAAAVKPAVKGKNNQPCRVSSQYPEDILQWCDLITANAQKSGLAPDLIAALIWQESGGDPQAYSKSGAVGLMQVMPRDGLAANFTCVNGPCFSSRPSIAELQDPEFNLDYGTGMLAGLVKRSGSLREALKSYGPMDVGYYYADKVLGIYKQYGE
jgi:soluble lytic murein transglycosylase-like protein